MAEFKYWAFLSYSHRDAKWGDWLHKALETYRVPRRLVGKVSRDGAVPERVYPVFRDREELPVSADLGANINEALGESRYLIVICSPQSAQSRWVNEEIKTFKKLGRDDRILALIVDGAPNASDGQAEAARSKRRANGRATKLPPNAPRRNRRGMKRERVYRITISIAVFACSTAAIAGRAWPISLPRFASTQRTRMRPTVYSSS